MASHQKSVRLLSKALPTQLEKYEWNIKLPPTLFTKNFTTGTLNFEWQKLSTGSPSKAGKCSVAGRIIIRPEDVKFWIWVRFKDSEGGITFRMKPFTIDFIKEGTVMNSIQKKLPSTEFSYDVNDDIYSTSGYADLSGHLTSSPLTGIRVSFFIEVEGNTPSPMELDDNIPGTNPKCNLNHLVNTFKPSIKEFCTSDRLSDFLIRCENQEFPAHRIVLSAASPVFSKMFDIDTKERDEKRVEIQDMTKTTVGLLLKWIYSGELDVPDFRNIVDLFKAAHKYCIDPLKNWCVAQILKNHMNVDNVLDIFAVGHTYQETVLLDTAKQIIKARKKTVFKNQEALQEFFQHYPEFVHELILS